LVFFELLILLNDFAMSIQQLKTRLDFPIMGIEFIIMIQHCCFVFLQEILMLIIKLLSAFVNFLI